MQGLVIQAEPDFAELTSGRSISFLGPEWLAGSAEAWIRAREGDRAALEYVFVNLSAIEAVTMLDWMTVVALADDVMASNTTMRELHLDLLDRDYGRLLLPDGFVASQRGAAPAGRQRDVRFSEGRYTLVGFLESMGTMVVLSQTGRPRVLFPGFAERARKLRSWYSTTKSGKPAGVLPLYRIKEARDCRQFLDSSRTQDWLSEIDRRVRETPMFQSEELWRAILFELALNCYEHSGAPGFVGARAVLSPTARNGELRGWCQWTYPSILHDLLRDSRKGFLEVSIADAGHGLASTLRNMYANSARTAPDDAAVPDILAFAFDEFGTSRPTRDCWATSRHALSRILALVAKFGGALRLRADGSELIYVSSELGFKRKPRELGYEPSRVANFTKSIPGTQIQILLPLVPRVQLRDKKSRRLIASTLPPSFAVEDDQPIGHLVPIASALKTTAPCVSTEERRQFRRDCETLVHGLRQRATEEPLVLDFSELVWPVGQFETFMFYLQNLLRNRPSLCVELDPGMLFDAIGEERSGAPTRLVTEIPRDEAREGTSEQPTHNEELSEERFFETFGVDQTSLLALTTEGQPHILGVPNQEYELALLGLADEPARLDQISKAHPTLDRRVLNLFLNVTNPLFHREAGAWSLAWSRRQIRVQGTRALSSHIDSVAVRSEAWRGSESGDERFYLPWLDIWTDRFLETSRILSRARQSDEIAQRLVSETRNAMKSQGRSLDEVGVLAAASAPSMLLATALHRWWPLTFDKPTVADIGHYVLVSTSEELPRISTEKAVLLVQSVLEPDALEASIQRKFALQGLQLAGVVAFVKFTHGGIFHDRINIRAFSQDLAPVLCINLACLPYPRRRPPDPDTPEELLYRVEPRASRPQRLTTLRRVFSDSRDRDLARRDQYLSKLDRPTASSPAHQRHSLISYGHFVFGRRHYAISVDIPRAFSGEIGDEIATWVADVCSGATERHRTAWERPEAEAFAGNVTFVLMPLHSQIHYLWPRIENRLAQRGVRQPYAFLEASLQSETGSAYRIPRQFENQLRRRFQQAKQSQEKVEGVRVLVLDDAMATGKTATTILASIHRAIDKLRNDENFLGVSVEPIAWLRYFSFLSQLDNASHLFWKRLAALGQPAFPIVFEHYAPFMGVRIYEADSCPACVDIARLRRHLHSIDYFHEGIRSWLERRTQELEPRAIDSPNAHPTRHELSKPLSIPDTEQFLLGEGRQFRAYHADTAIWRFYELEHLTYPLQDLLAQLHNLFPADSGSSNASDVEYERYRLAVYEWCFRNRDRRDLVPFWGLLQTLFLREVSMRSSNIEPIFEWLGSDAGGPVAREVVSSCVATLAELEANRARWHIREGREDREFAIRLDSALKLFFLSAGLSGPRQPANSDQLDFYLVVLSNAVGSLEPGHSFVRNLYLEARRHRHSASAAWSLNVVAENLYRGRDPVSDPDGHHDLLPKLVQSVAQGIRHEANLGLLHSSISLFLRALEALESFLVLGQPVESSELVKLCRDALVWLAPPAEKRLEDEMKPSLLLGLKEELRLDSRFCQSFDEVLRPAVSMLGEQLEKRAREHPKLEFIFDDHAVPADTRLLTHASTILNFLTNRLIEPAMHYPGLHYSRLTIYPGEGSHNPSSFQLSLETSFADSQTASAGLNTVNGVAEMTALRTFGVDLQNRFESVTHNHESDYQARLVLRVPSGFSPPGGDHDL